MPTMLPFNNPTKPIGPFYTEEEAVKIRKEKGFTVKEDAGRGWRRMIASPEPKRIVENLILLKQLWGSNIVILAGGGEYPLWKIPMALSAGIAASFIDKDLSAGCFAEAIETDVFLILTGVERVCLNYGKENQKELGKITVAESERVYRARALPSRQYVAKRYGGKSILQASSQGKKL